MGVEITPAAEGATDVASLEQSTAQPGLSDVHAELLRDPELQFDRAGFTPPDIPDWLLWIGDILRWVAPVTKYVFWAGLIVIVGLILFAIGREVLKLRAPRARATDVPAIDAGWRPAPDAALNLLATADALAAEGLYAEAAHLLLLRSVEDIQRRQPKAVRVSLTAREIAVLDAIPDAARPAFRLIAQVVERSLFGDAGVGASDFAECRRAYEGFALPEGWNR
ncbi:MAG TPA: hypothetical protein VFF48_01740 [Brevundimonas sp.]|nr:hypothetical protein [Brevundimonas sp.]